MLSAPFSFAFLSPFLSLPILPHPHSTREMAAPSVTVTSSVTVTRFKTPLSICKPLDLKDKDCVSRGHVATLLCYILSSFRVAFFRASSTPRGEAGNLELSSSVTPSRAGRGRREEV